MSPADTGSVTPAADQPACPPTTTMRHRAVTVTPRSLCTQRCTRRAAISKVQPPSRRRDQPRRDQPHHHHHQPPRSPTSPRSTPPPSPPPTALGAPDAQPHRDQRQPVPPAPPHDQLRRQSTPPPINHTSINPRSPPRRPAPHRPAPSRCTVTRVICYQRCHYQRCHCSQALPRDTVVSQLHRRLETARRPPPVPPPPSPPSPPLRPRVGGPLRTRRNEVLGPRRRGVDPFGHMFRTSPTTRGTSMPPCNRAFHVKAASTGVRTMELQSDRRTRPPA